MNIVADIRAVVNIRTTCMASVSFLARSRMAAQRVTMYVSNFAANAGTSADKLHILSIPFVLDIYGTRHPRSRWKAPRDSLRIFTINFRIGSGSCRVRKLPPANCFGERWGHKKPGGGTRDPPMAYAAPLKHAQLYHAMMRRTGSVTIISLPKDGCSQSAYPSAYLMCSQEGFGRGKRRWRTFDPMPCLCII